MLRVKEEEMSRSCVRGRGLTRKEAGHQTEEDEEDEDEEVAFSESELELYEQYKAAGYRDLVSTCPTNQLPEQTKHVSMSTLKMNRPHAKLQLCKQGHVVI